ncbi:MAG: hypothetical protein ACRDYX_14680 [Egibacteraceae bacterium]
MRTADLRRWLTAGLLLAVTLIALLGSRSVDLPILTDGCGNSVCAEHAGSVPAAGDHGFPAHDPCLHDDACGGGGALGLGGMLLLAVVAAKVLPEPVSRTASRRIWDVVVPPLALLVGGIERPPRFAR